MKSKAALAALGVAVFGAAVYFIARGKKPTINTVVPTGKPTSSKNIAASLLTSQNFASLGGLVDRIGGGSASVATPGGGGSGFVTSYD